VRKSLADHRLLYRLKCSELVGTEFQAFFERIMAKADKTFIAVKPTGAAGDWKCDGYSAATKTVYQCYAPEALTVAKTCDKVLVDFDGARRHWGNQMKRWAFVLNAQALPPQVVSLLERLQSQHSELEIDHLGRDKLWDLVVCHLAHEVLNELLGEVSSTSDVVEAHLQAAKRGLHGGDDARIHGLCVEVLALTEGDEALHACRAEAHEILAILALKERDLREARHHLREMAARLDGDTRVAVRANYHRLLGLVLEKEEKDQEAEAEFFAVMAVQPGAGQDAAGDAKLRAIQCASKADLVLNWCHQGEGERAAPYGDEIISFIRQDPNALDGQLICHAVDALVTLAACVGERQWADDALGQLDEYCQSKKQAYEASMVLQGLAGRTARFFDQPEIGLKCSELAVHMAQRADRDDFYWAAVFNMAVSYLQQGEIEEADKRLNLLLPLLESAKVDNAIKAGVLSLASELASERGDVAKALDFQRRMVPYAADDPVNMIGTLHGIGRKLQAAGRVSEAFEAFAKTAQLAGDQQIPGEARFDILARLAEAGIMTGRWDEAEKAIEELAELPRPPQFVDDAVARLQKQIEGMKELRGRIDAIKRVASSDGAITLLEANAAALKPLLAWWREIEPTGVWFSDKKKAGALDEADRGLRVLYDYWGGGGAARIMANLRRFAPAHFSPFIEVRSLEEIRRAIRMFALISDVLVLLWKGPIQPQRTAPFVPIRDVIGGAGYIGFFGTVLRSPSGIPWVAALGNGAYLPEEVCRLLLTEAAGLLEQGRLILLPAPAVGCWQPEHGPCEKLLVDLTGATPVLDRSADQDASPVGLIPFFEDVPIPAIVDLLGERPEQTRRLRLALIRKTRELRGHGSLEAGKRELQDEIQDAFAEWAAIHRALGRKNEWHNREDEMSSTALRFQDQWSPIFMLSQLGYRLRVEPVGAAAGPSPRQPSYLPAEGTPFGSWLLPPGPHILSAEARSDSGGERAAQTPDAQ